MSLIVVGAVQQPDAVGPYPEVLHQGAGAAEIGGAAAHLAVTHVLPGGLAAQPDLAALAQGELLRGEGVEQLGPTPGAGEVDGPGHGELGHQDAAVRQRREAVDALAERAHRPLGQELLRIDPAQPLVAWPDLHQPQLGAGETRVVAGLLLAGELAGEPGEQRLHVVLALGRAGRRGQEGDGRRPDQAGIKQPEQGRHQLCHRILPNHFRGGDYMSDRPQ